jgi:hypothetical protein
MEQEVNMLEPCSAHSTFAALQSSPSAEARIENNQPAGHIIQKADAPTKQVKPSQTPTTGINT